MHESAFGGKADISQGLPDIAIYEYTPKPLLNQFANTLADKPKAIDQKERRIRISLGVGNCAKK